MSIPFYLESFNPGRRKQKPSEDEDVVVPKKAKLEEGKGNTHAHLDMVSRV